VAEEALDDLNTRLAEEVKARREALVMTTRIRGRVTQRFSIANHRTTREDIREVFEAMTRIGRELAPDRGR
jgi:glutamate/tyrosine decarboxylase-like PLP-dependent enzyme